MVRVFPVTFPCSVTTAEGMPSAQGQGQGQGVGTACVTLQRMPSFDSAAFISKRDLWQDADFAQDEEVCVLCLLQPHPPCLPASLPPCSSPAGDLARW